MPFNQAKASSETPDMTLEVAAIFRLDYVYLNHAKKPIDDKRIRLAHELRGQSRGDHEGGLLRLWRDPELLHAEGEFLVRRGRRRLPYDIEKAKALVSEAGYDGTPIKLMVDTGNAPSKQIATILQQGWRRPA